jgi:anaerobic magnesium-protoporphyrin IX monomethyl ester cyclase
MLSGSDVARQAAAHGPSVLLVGPNQQENLGLQYLAASAERAGFSAGLVGFNGRDDIAQATAAVLRERALLVGLGLTFQYAVSDYLELAAVLRERGYQNHLTAGGHVATFCWRELLETCPALDSVVRHEGEHTLVKLLCGLQRGMPIAGTAGCAWRERGVPVLGPTRPLVTDLDTLPHPQRGKQPYVVAGIPIAFMLTARGCSGECAYCCVRAFASVAEGPRLRLRDPEAVALELAELVRKGVRIVLVQDDLFVLPNEHRAVARMQAIRNACERHGVGRIGWWIKSRPESITPAVLAAAQQLGAIHVFLGVESPVRERLEYLGRVHRPEHNRRALQLCRAAGVHPSFNLMLFDPESPLEHVAQAIDFAAEHLDVPWNVCRTEIYPGTELFQRLARQNRLEGDFRSWGYRIRDLRAELAFRLLRVSLHERAFAHDSLHNKLISLAFAAQAQQWMFPGQETDRLAQQVEQIGCAVRRDTVDALRRTVDFADRASPDDWGAANAFCVREGLGAAQRDLPFHTQVDRLWELLHARGHMLLEHRARLCPAGQVSCQGEAFRERSYAYRSTAPASQPSAGRGWPR